MVTMQISGNKCQFPNGLTPIASDDVMFQVTSAWIVPQLHKAVEDLLKRPFT